MTSQLASQRVLNQSIMEPRKYLFFRPQMPVSELLSITVKALTSKIWLKLCQVMNQSMMEPKKFTFSRLQMLVTELPSMLRPVLRPMTSQLASQQVMNPSMMELRKFTFFRPQMLDTELLSTSVKILSSKTWLRLVRSQLVMNLSMMVPRKFTFSRPQMLDIEQLSTHKPIQSLSNQLLLLQLDQRRFPSLRLQSPKPTLPSTTNTTNKLQLRLLQKRRRLTQLAQKEWIHGYTRLLRKIQEFSQILTVLNYTDHMVSWLSLLQKKKSICNQSTTSE
jgi:hypothetical protein